MNKYFTRRDISEMLNIKCRQFDYAIKVLNINPKVSIGFLPFYTIQNMIDVYRFIHKRREIILESKINYKEIVL